MRYFSESTFKDLKKCLLEWYFNFLHLRAASYTLVFIDVLNYVTICKQISVFHASLERDLSTFKLYPSEMLACFCKLQLQVSFCKTALYLYCKKAQIKWECAFSTKCKSKSEIEYPVRNFSNCLHHCILYDLWWCQS